MIIKRTVLSNRPKAAAWVSDPWFGHGTHGFAEVVMSNDYPTHSAVLGPDGKPLEYEPRPAMGFAIPSSGGIRKGGAA